MAVSNRHYITNEIVDYVGRHWRPCFIFKTKNVRFR